MQRLEIVQKVKEHILVLTLKGQLDVQTAEQMQSVLASLAESTISHVVMDFAGITLVDSSGIGVLVSVYKLTRARGGDTVLANVEAQPREVFRILNLTKAITLYDSISDALRDLIGRGFPPVVEPVHSSTSDSRTDISRPNYSA